MGFFDKLEENASSHSSTATATIPTVTTPTVISSAPDRKKKTNDDSDILILADIPTAATPIPKDPEISHEASVTDSAVSILGDIAITQTVQTMSIAVDAPAQVDPLALFDTAETPAPATSEASSLFAAIDTPTPASAESSASQADTHNGESVSSFFGGGTPAETVAVIAESTLVTDTPASPEVSLFGAFSATPVKEDIKSTKEEATPSFVSVAETKAPAPIVETIESADQNPTEVLTDTVKRLTAMKTTKTKERERLMTRVNEINEEISRQRKEAADLTKQAKEIDVEGKRIDDIIKLLEGQMAA